MADKEILDLAAKLGIKVDGNSFFCPIHDDKTPSLSIYRKNGEIKFKCFKCGTGGFLIGLVKFCNRCETAEAYKWLKDNTNLVRSYVPQNRIVNVSIERKENITIAPYDKFKYFAQFGITENVLNANRVFSLKSFQRGERTIYSKQTNPIYAYQIEENYYKIYQPLVQPKKYKFNHMGVLTEKTKFGLDNCNKELNYIIITGGEKDVLTLQSMGFNAVSFNSESDINTELCEELVNDYKIVFVLYDNDDTGVKCRNSLCQIKGVYPLNVEFEIIPKEIKDISDFVAASNKQSIEELKQKIETTISFY